MQILVFVSKRPEGVKSLMSGGLKLCTDGQMGDVEERRRDVRVFGGEHDEAVVFAASVGAIRGAALYVGEG